MRDKLTPKQLEFYVAYVELRNATAAYKRAYDCKRMTAKTITNNAWELTRHPVISAMIEKLHVETRSNVLDSAKKVADYLADIATADVNELVQHRRVNCRHCNGLNHRYQWRDQDELALKQADVLDANAAKKKGTKQTPMPDERGGFGFKFNADPHPECPHCLGEGRGDMHVMDTRKLSPQARRLYAGVKRTKDGLQILTRDQDAALINFGKTLGMFKEKVEISGPNGEPIKTVTAALPADPTEASRIYQQIMKVR